MDSNILALLEQIEKLNAIGISLSKERNLDQVLDLIVAGAMKLTNADGGSLYLLTPDKKLEFYIVLNNSLNIHKSSHTSHLGFNAIPLYDEQNNENLKSIIACSILKNKTINIPNIYQQSIYDFTGSQTFDKKMAYHTQSILTVPMTNHEGENIGGFQLINALDPLTQQVIAFSASDQQLVESLASQAAIILTNRNLLQAQRELFEAFIQVLATAIDTKSPFTSAHCRRVPLLSMMLAEAVQECEHEALKDFKFTEDELYELRIAAWLHDCGKLITPLYLLDKATKLQLITDRIQLIEQRAEIILRDLEIDFLKQMQTYPEKEKNLKAIYQERVTAIKDDLVFVKRCNEGSEQMSPKDLQRLQQVATHYTWRDKEGLVQAFIQKEELYNLCIERGTLTKEEREEINAHVKLTYEMLNALPFPNKMKRVPEIAASHHERINGTGYPRGLRGDQMLLQSRIVAIADIFEALTAVDRPYKKAMTLSQALKVLWDMKNSGHIDPDLFSLLVREKVYLRYAQEFLSADQIDEVDELALLQ